MAETRTGHEKGGRVGGEKTIVEQPARNETDRSIGNRD